MDLNSVFLKYNKLLGELGGDTWNIYRPNYSAVDNAPVLIHSNKKFRADPVGYRFSEPVFNGVENYDVFGDRSLVQTGDLLIKPVSDNMTPPLTILHYMPIKAMIGFRSSKKGMITESRGDDGSYDIVYNNIYFDLLGKGYPSGRISQAPDSEAQPTQHAVMYKRDNIDKLYMQLIEFDSSGLEFRKWLIEEIDFSGNLMVLTLRTSRFR
jgi:hypothetical protein